MHIDSERRTKTIKMKKRRKCEEKERSIVWFIHRNQHDIIFRINSYAMHKKCILMPHHCVCVCVMGLTMQRHFKKKQTSNQDRKEKERGANDRTFKRARIKNDLIWNGDTFQLKVVIKWLYLCLLLSLTHTLFHIVAWGQLCASFCPFSGHYHYYDGNSIEMSLLKMT